MQAYETVRQLVAQNYDLPVGAVTGETRLDGDMVANLNWAMVAVACEKAFAVTIPDSEIDSLTTVRKLVQYVELKKA